MISPALPFVLRRSKDERRVFQQNLVYKSDWTDAHELDGMCESLVRLDDMNAHQVPIIRKGVSERLHWIPMDPQHRERIYRRSGEKAIRDYFNARGHLPYATDAERDRAQAS